MKLSISKKFAKRSIKCLALFAPIAYLFGSLFFGLNGAHGDSGFSADYDVVTEYKHIRLDSIVRNGDFSNSDYWMAYNFPSTFEYADGGVYVSSNGYGSCSLSQENISFVFGHTYFVSFFAKNVSSVSVLQFRCPASTVKVSFTPSTDLVRYYHRFTVDSGTSFDLLGAGAKWFCSNFFIVDLTSSYGVGNEPSNADFLTDFPEDYYPYGVIDEYIPVYSQATYTDFIFNQFFQKDNFLVQWGRNAISDNPVGFAPFGAFFKFIDENMLHLSDSQIGLMGYGYIYYCLHILIAFLAFDCVAFIPQLIMKVIHQFNKGVDTDD